ncbi:MAG: ATP-binding protein [Sedimentisphaerales bacterium]|jgi:PAS domain S-box-containing protein
MKIGHKLTLGFVGLVLLIAAFGYACLHTSQTALEESIGTSVSGLSEQILDKIGRNTSHRVEEAQFYATSELAKEYIALSNAQFENMSDPNSYIAQIDRDWTNGADLPIIRELTNNKLAQNFQSKQRYYQNKYGYPLLGEILITNRFGVNVAQTNRTTDYYQADEEWWQVAQKDGLFVGDVNYDESSGTFSTEIAVRIDDANGNFAGVIKVVQNIKETINTLNEAKLAAEYKTLHLHLIDHNGKIIYSTKGYTFGQEAANRFTNADFTKQKLYVINKNGHLLTATQSKKHKAFGELRWILAVEIDTAEIFAPITDLRNTMLLAGTVIIGLALLAGSITYRSVVVPIAELQKATIQIASGNLDTNLTKSNSGEINRLVNSFQRMAQQLKKTINDLNDEVNGRKKTEENLRQNEQFLANIFDNFQDGISILDKDLNIVKANAWMEKVFQDSMPLVGKKCFKAYHKLDSVCPDCPLITTLQTGLPGRGIVSIPCPGREWVEISSSALKDSNGNITGVIEHVKDITERKKAEDALRESEARLRTILDNIQTGVFIIEPEKHTIVYANPVAARLIGASQKQLVNSMCHKYICPADIGHCPITDLGQTVDNAERVLLTAKGEKRPIIKTVVTIMFNGKKHLLENFVDISEYKKAEHELERLNKELEFAVLELSISNRQLHDFVHVAAHDLKTPVRGIGTLADWILNDYGDKLDNQGREHVRLLKTRAIRIDKLIDGMLQFSKITRTRHKEKQVNLNVVLSDIKGTISSSNHVEIAVDSMPNITCERDHIELVFQNLMANAVTFMDKTNGLVKVGCVEQGDFWKFYVSDNGPGIEQKYFEKIFRIFQTLPKNDESETAGIGLAVAKKIVELYGGKIWVESQPGSGSTFYFTFPRTLENISYAATKTCTAC